MAAKAAGDEGGRVVRWVGPAVLGAVWWWAAARYALGTAGPVEAAILAGGWGLSLLPVHCVPRTPLDGRPGPPPRSRRGTPDDRGPAPPSGPRGHWRAWWTSGREWWDSGRGQVSPPRGGPGDSGRGPWVSRRTRSTSGGRPWTFRCRSGGDGAGPGQGRAGRGGSRCGARHAGRGRWRPG